MSSRGARTIQDVHARQGVHFPAAPAARMGDKCGTSRPLECRIMALAGSPAAKPHLPSRRSLPRLRLDTIDRVRRELTRLYLLGREGHRDVAEVSRLANVLALIGRLLEGSELERRLEAVEHQLGTETEEAK